MPDICDSSQLSGNHLEALPYSVQMTFDSIISS